MVLCSAAGVSRCEGLCYRVNGSQVRHTGQILGGQAVMESAGSLDGDRACYAIRRKSDKGSRSGLLVGAVGYEGRRDT